MNLPYPFDNASGVKADAHGTIDLVDAQGKTLARIPMMTAFELSPEAEGDGYADGFGVGYGDGSGFGYGADVGDGYGDGYGSGDGYGDDVGDGSGSGRSK
jgi:hypothetical protein